MWGEVVGVAGGAVGIGEVVGVVGGDLTGAGGVEGADLMVGAVGGVGEDALVTEEVRAVGMSLEVMCTDFGDSS